MKRIFSALLCLALLLSVLPASVFSQPATQPSIEVLANNDDGSMQLRPVGSVRTFKDTRENVIYPAETLNDQSAVQGTQMKQHYVLVNNGATGQYYKTEIYKGSKVSADALVDDWYGIFPTDSLYNSFELTISWDTANRQLGEYTVRTFATDSLNNVVGQVYYSTVYIVSKATALKTIVLEDNSTSEQASAYTMNTGETRHFSLKATPTNHTYGRTISLLSSNPSVVRATELGGIITVEALKDGVATIYVNMGGKDTSLLVTVVTPITSLALSRSTLSLSVGSEYWMTVLTTPAGHLNGLTWTSSVPEVATVKNGLVKTLSFGTTVITVSKQGFSASCSLTVTPKYPATSLSLSSEEAVLHLSATLQLSTVIAPVNSDSPILWESSDAAVATVSQTGLVTANGAGTAIITAAAGSLKAVCSLTVPACPGAAFTDMPSYDDWAHEGIAYAVSRNLFAGTSAKTFSPKLSMTRAMLATVLYRLADAEKPESECPFADVPTDSWYYNGVVWAAGAGIVAGDDKGNFLPEINVTREQIVQMLYNFTQKCTALSTENRADLSVFPDADIVSGWAEEAMSWAVAEGLMTGVTSWGKVILNPAGEATREQVASILMRYLQKMELA